MVFDSPVFLFIFLPAALTLYYAMPHKGKGPLLLTLSLLFYAWGDAPSLWILLGSAGVNIGLGLIVERSKTRPTRKISLLLAVSLNLCLLVVCKYLGFVMTNLTAVGIGSSLGSDFGHVRLPLGISFFTFSAIAYLVDIYRGKTPAERNLIALGLYFTHFARVIAGPIVRYSDAPDEYRGASGATLDHFSEGVWRFVLGLGKKVLIANPAATLANEAFMRTDSLDAPTAWLGLFSYTIQIYFDFSGYTDMAVGLGRMFGFRFGENFNYPYTSQSIQEFWRRWHISLSTWFRDYLYIPLGGNRVSPARTYFNLIIVFLLCGLWHGAGWTFIAWGVWHGLFLAAERAGLDRVLKSLWKPLRHLYALLVIMIGWVFFRADDLTQALAYLRALFSLSHGLFEYFLMTFFNRQTLLVLVVGTVGSMPVFSLFQPLRHRVERLGGGHWLGFYDWGTALCAAAFILIVLITSTMELAITTYTPFIYAKF